jgi:nitronate monooxygenase
MSFRKRTEAFCQRFGLRAPVLFAPMAGACPPSLSIAVTQGGGMGGCGVLLMQPQEILDWTRTVRTATSAPFQLNNWVPDPPPARDRAHEDLLRGFLAQWGPEVAAAAGDATPPDFAAQCEAMLEAAPAVVSSVMGLFAPAYVEKLKARGISWFAAVSTLAEARAAEAAGADAIVAQGSEAGGHRAAFDASRAPRELVGLVSLVPAIADAVKVPVIATGGIADGRGAAAAFALGASAVQIGTRFLRSPESDIPRAWADALGRATPEGTTISRVFSGRFGRSLDTSFVRAATAPEAPAPAPYPVQRGLTATMRKAGIERGDVERMQAWSGQSAALGRARPAAEVVQEVWDDAQALLL